MNKTFLLGRMTADPELRVMQDENQTSVTRFRIAVPRKYKKDEADFINCVCFGKTAETIQKYFTKGSLILVAGRIQTGSYNDREGKKVYTTDIIVEDFDFVQSKGDGQAKTEQQPPVDENGFMSAPASMEADLPFN